jgi:hypothetical protein
MSQHTVHNRCRSCVYSPSPSSKSTASPFWYKLNDFGRCPLAITRSAIPYTQEASSRLGIDRLWYGCLNLAFCPKSTISSRTATDARSIYPYNVQCRMHAMKKVPCGDKCTSLYAKSRCHMPRFSSQGMQFLRAQRVVVALVVNSPLTLQHIVDVLSK